MTYLFERVLANMPNCINHCSRLGVSAKRPLPIIWQSLNFTSSIAECTKFLSWPLFTTQ